MEWVSTRFAIDDILNYQYFHGFRVHSDGSPLDSLLEPPVFTSSIHRSTDGYSDRSSNHFSIASQRLQTTPRRLRALAKINNPNILPRLSFEKLQNSIQAVSSFA